MRYVPIRRSVGIVALVLGGVVLAGVIVDAVDDRNDLLGVAALAGLHRAPPCDLCRTPGLAGMSDRRGSLFVGHRASLFSAGPKL